MPMTPTVIFEVDAALLQVLEARLGPPIDSYLMGWQVWLHPVSESGDRDVELELRLHPPAGFTQPEGVDHHLLWDDAITQVTDGADVLELGSETRELASLWTLLEVYPVFAPATVDETRRWSEQLLDRDAAGAGEVDHDHIAGRFRREGHAADIPSELRATLG